MCWKEGLVQLVILGTNQIYLKILNCLADYIMKRQAKHPSFRMKRFSSRKILVFIIQGKNCRVLMLSHQTNLSIVLWHFNSLDLSLREVQRITTILQVIFYSQIKIMKKVKLKITHYKRIVLRNYQDRDCHSLKVSLLSIVK